MSVDGPNVIVGFGQQVAVAAPKARNMKARGKREAQRNASPLVTTNNLNRALESAKYQRRLFRSFRASLPLLAFTRGDAPHVVRRLPLAFIFRAFGAQSDSLCNLCFGPKQFCIGGAT